MDRNEALSNQHSATSQNQHQKQNHFTAEDTEATEEDKTSPLTHGMLGNEQEGARQRAEALVRKIGEACDELERLAEENPALVGRVTKGRGRAQRRLSAAESEAGAGGRCDARGADG